MLAETASDALARDPPIYGLDGTVGDFSRSPRNLLNPGSFDVLFARIVQAAN
jgi:hypothetical protein